MTIGEKIRYLRKQRGITQQQLATLAEIHPVSIRKYETNRAEPQFPQVHKLAKALNISTNALTNLKTSDIRFETVGDLMGILILLCNSNVISITGVRMPDGFISKETISVKINPLLSSFFKLSSIGNSTDSQQFNFDEVQLLITSPLLYPDLIKWERVNHLYNDAISKFRDIANDATRQTLEQFALTKEQIELEMQRSMIHLDLSDGIKVNTAEY